MKFTHRVIQSFFGEVAVFLENVLLKDSHVGTQNEGGGHHPDAQHPPAPVRRRLDQGHPAVDDAGLLFNLESSTNKNHPNY